MDFEKEIVGFITDKVGGVVILAEASDEIMFADTFFCEKYGTEIIGQDGSDIFLWLDDCPRLEPEQAAVEWEYIETDTKKYYRFYSSLFEREGKRYSIHLMSDITEYMGLNRDITKYMSFFKKLSAFQTAVLKKLSDTYYELLPMLADYFKTSKAYFMIQQDKNVDIITYGKIGNQYSNDRIPLTPELEKVFFMDGEDDILLESFAPEIQEIMKLNGNGQDSSYRKLCGGEVSEQKYAVYLNVWPGMDKESLRESTLLSVINLYIENGIMKEKLLYSSEHDQLTGLYNKGKYLDMMEHEYKEFDSIGVFNFDVNNLKTMNDTYGHEAGDRLIIKAANSIRKIINNKVHGYRTGGDEFMVIAHNITEDEFTQIKDRWEKELARLNMADDGIDCIVALGAVFGKKGSVLSDLIADSDALMYEDKKKKKKPGEEIR